MPIEQRSGPPRAGRGLEQVACNLCGATDAAPLFSGRDHLSGDEFHVVRCRRCHLCYVNPRPASDAIGRYYAEGYFGKRHPFLADFMMGLRASKLGPGGNRRLLDIGCGRGDFILRCRRDGWSVAGVEQRQSPIMQMKDGLGIEVFEPDHLTEIPSESFDVVTIWHVLEHVPDPAWTLANVQRVLKPGGTALIEVPNFGGWQGRLGREVWFHLDVPRHLFHFERAPLERLLCEQGLQPFRWQTFSLEYDAFGLAQTLLNRICRQPNHLFQLLIRHGHASGGGVRDTALSVALFPFALAAALPASVLAAVAKQGGVLRVWAHKDAPPARRDAEDRLAGGTGS